MTNEIFKKGMALVLGVLFLILPLSSDVRATENIDTSTSISSTEKMSIGKKIALIVSTVVGVIGVAAAAIWKFCSNSGESSEVQHISGGTGETKPAPTLKLYIPNIPKNSNTKKPSKADQIFENAKQIHMEKIRAKNILNSNGVVGAVTEMVKTGQRENYSEKELEDLLVQALDPSNWEEFQ